MSLFDELKAKVGGKGVKIVFPEAISLRILGAAVRLHNENILTPILVGNTAEVHKLALENNLNLTGIELLDPAIYDIRKMVDTLVERRKGKTTNRQASLSLRNDVNYFGTMLVYMGLADGLVSGAIHYTADTIRPALQIIKTKPGVSSVSGAFLMLGPNDERMIFGDCAININPTSEQLAETANESAITGRMFGIDPKIAMLSFSTMGSAKSDESDKVVKATYIARERFPELVLDGEMQFDAAIVPKVAESKAPYSDVAGQANILIFPTLDAGNIGYKIAQRFGKFEAIGPILQGLNMPVSDLSRGCSEEDVYKLAIITALQALQEKETKEAAQA